ncbi:MAG: carbamoyl-phosphate synthase small subunit [Bdellovibrionales bacterium]|nr:carbamoyl-phosphate synthase small subunit [Bdellovibrionales bacterium]
MSFFEAALYLENGHLFEGKGFGAEISKGGEAVFNTGMSGYQEIYTDPSYLNQIVVMGSSQIGNTGINAQDLESSSLLLSGVVVREYCAVPSNWRSVQSLSDYLVMAKVPGIGEVDTREITQILREEGAQKGIIFPLDKIKKTDIKIHAQKLLESVPSMEGLDLVSKVSCQKPYRYSEQGWKEDCGTIVVYDFGVKWNILRHLGKRGFQIQVVPFHTPFEEVMKYRPKAVLLSNGPGDPAMVPHSVQEIQKLIGKVPILAICMGHQLLARAIGAQTYKLKFGHHGINHPVKDLSNNKIIITSQNHGFAVRADTLPGREVQLNHVNLNDGTVEGFCSNSLKVYSVQFHPESAPGPSDASYIFDHFIRGFIQ